jgi:transposase
MPAPNIAMRRIKEVLRLKLDFGLSHKQIARALKVSVGAVSKYGRLAERAGLKWTDLALMDETDIEARLMPPRGSVASSARIQPDCALIHRELKRKGVTLQLLWEEYVDAHGQEATYRYTQFCQRYHEFQASLKRSMRQTHRAGEKLFADYAGQTLPMIDALTGELRQANIFVAVLGASNYTYACATARQTMADWLASLGLAMAYMGGVVELIIPDNPRALIARPDRYEPGANRTVVDFAQHYGCVVLPARPYRARDKAKVEVAVQIVERWVLARLRNRRFLSLVEVNQAIAELLEDLNTRPFKKLPGSRRELFETLERPVLKPLPALAYEFAEFKTCRVGIDYHIEVDEHYYSVPHSLGRQQVDARITRHAVEILFHGKRVASHVRSDCRGKHTTLPEHMPASHRAHMEWTPGRLLNWGTRIGPATARLVRHLLSSKPHPEMGYRACLGLLALARKYGNERLEAACLRALQIGSPTRRSVLSILQNGLDRQAVASDPQLELNLPDHENVRGPDYYH